MEKVNNFAAQLRQRKKFDSLHVSIITLVIVYVVNAKT